MSDPTDPGDVPEWVTPWCELHLGSPPTAVLHRSEQMSSVLGLRLADGTQVALKSRESEAGREQVCVSVQAELARRGLPVAGPLTEVVVDANGAAVHAERWAPGGELLRGDSPREAKLSARLLAWFMAALADLEVDGSTDPPPYWLGWAYPDATLDPKPWPAMSFLIERDATLVPVWVSETARQATARIRAADLPLVLGHGDWEAQNLRWSRREPLVVHDWDSLALVPEAALVGAASGCFASAETPTLAPLESSRAFLAAYQSARDRDFSPDEVQVAWAASLWPAAHNARAEALFDTAPAAGRPLAEQYGERLRLAGCAP